MIQSIGVTKAIKQIEKIGKKKHWPGGHGGHKVGLTVKSAAAGGTVDFKDDDLEAEFT